MKKLYHILLLFLYFFSHTQSQWKPSPESCFFAIDIDEVLAQKCACHDVRFAVKGIWYEPSNTYNWFSFLDYLRTTYQKDACGHKEALYDEEGNAINGLTFHFLYHGMKNPRCAHYIPWVVDTLEGLRKPIDGTVEICRYLKKEKGYTIVFATNKDRPSYDAFAKTGGKTITDLPEKVFVAQPGNNRTFLKKLHDFAKQNHVPNNYKKLAYKTINIQPTEQIRHVPSTKPHTAYYEYVHKTVQQEHNKQHMIFIDDREDNIDGVEEYAKTDNNATAIGIPFKNPYQLVQELIGLNVLSKTHDKEFIAKMKQYK